MASGLEAGVEAKVAARVHDILHNVAADEVSVKAIRKQLEEDCSVDLSTSEARAWVKEQITHCLEGLDPADEPATQETEKAVVTKEKRPDTKQNAGGADEDPSHPLISSDMAAVVGVSRANHFRLNKLIWSYIKEHELQDPKNRQYILCDEKLKRIFDKDRIHTFSMTKCFGRHILAEDQAQEEDPHDRPALSKDAPKAGSKKKQKGSSAKGPYKGSAELADFLGFESNNRFEINKALWAYIKKHELQDPQNKSRIICDDVLKQLFDVEEMTSFNMAKLLSRHFNG